MFARDKERERKKSERAKMRRESESERPLENRRQEDRPKRDERPPRRDESKDDERYRENIIMLFTSIIVTFVLGEAWSNGRIRSVS